MFSFCTILAQYQLAFICPSFNFLFLFSLFSLSLALSPVPVHLTVFTVIQKFCYTFTQIKCTEHKHKQLTQNTQLLSVSFFLDFNMQMCIRTGVICIPCSIHPSVHFCHHGITAHLTNIISPSKQITPLIS